MTEHNTPHTESNRSLGNKIEERIARHIETKGYTVVGRNFQIKWGEIDIIARENDTGQIVFFEVKYRKTELFGHPLDTYTPAKRRALRRTIFVYCMKNKIDPENVRVDFIGVMPQKETFRVWWVRGVEL